MTGVARVMSESASVAIRIARIAKFVFFTTNFPSLFVSLFLSFPQHHCSIISP